jgi:hypothetical protein
LKTLEQSSWRVLEKAAQTLVQFYYCGANLDADRSRLREF